MPQINNLAGSFGARGFVVLAINLGQSISICQTYQNNYPNILVLRDTNYAVWTTYNINNYIPCNYLLDHDLDQTVDYRGTGYNHSTYSNRMQNLLSPVSVALTPYNTQVQAGGVLTLDLVRQNWTAQTQTYWIKLAMDAPVGNMYKPRQLSQGGNTTRTKNLNYTVPYGTPIGYYEVRCLIGLPPGDLWYKEWYDVEVIP